MLRNYFLVALRNLRKQRLHTFVQVAGLSIGLCCFILIAQFVRDELSFDTWHGKSDRIFRAWVLEDYGDDQIFFNSYTPLVLADALGSAIPEVESTVQLDVSSSQVMIGEKKFTETISIVTNTFFQVFDFPIVEGLKTGTLDNPRNVVLSQSEARKLFGSTSAAVGQQVSVRLAEEYLPYVVVAVAEDPPTNSSVTFNLLMSGENLKHRYPERAFQQWFNVTVETYVLLSEGFDLLQIDEKLGNMMKAQIPEMQGTYTVGLQPLTDIHLNTDIPAAIAPVSDPQYSIILGVIVLFILIIAGINYITISVATSVNRSKEVGVRKSSGATRQQITSQYLFESLFVTLVAFVIAAALAYFLTPLFNDLSGKSLSMEFNGFIILLAFSSLILIGLLAGSYPALVLSGINPIAILKGSFSIGNTRNRLRTAMVIFQFTISMFLISFTLIMTGQIKFLQNKNLGFDKDQQILIQLNISNEGGFLDRLDRGMALGQRFKTSLGTRPEIVSTVISSQVPGGGPWVQIGFTDDQGNYRGFETNFVDEGYLAGMNMELVQGRFFDVQNPSDVTSSIVVNEAFVSEFDLGDPIGKRIPGKNFGDHQIIGVVKDFNYNSLYAPVAPLVLCLNARVIVGGIEDISYNSSPIPKLTVKLAGGSIEQGIVAIRDVWATLAGGEEFNYSFLEENLNQQYQNEQNLSRIITISAIIAIAIACLGLFGLASISLSGRTKEVGIRKVLGASPGSIVLQLGKGYGVVILISFLLATPITYFLVEGWLQSFQYKIAYGPMPFVFSGLIVATLAVATLSYNLLKTSFVQPAESLKYE